MKLKKLISNNLIPFRKTESSKVAMNGTRLPKGFMFALLAFAFLFGLVDLVSAQNRSSRWIYTSTSGENIKQYYRSDVKKIGKNRRGGWVKMILPDGRFVIASHLWDCNRSLSKTNSITIYDLRGVVIGKSKGSGWQEVIPESINERLFLRVCGFQTDNTWVRVITENANLRSSNSRYSSVLRIARKGQRFRVIEYRKDNIWHNIVDEKTQEDFWIHRTTVKVPSKKKEKHKKK